MAPSPAPLLTEGDEGCESEPTMVFNTSRENRHADSDSSNTFREVSWKIPNTDEYNY